MSLRLRLTLLYSTLLGGVLLLFGLVVYLLVSGLLVSQIDNRLESTYLLIAPAIRATANGDVHINAFPELGLTEGVFVQLWSSAGERREVSANIALLERPLDEVGLEVSRPIYRTATIGDDRLRVLSVPLEVSDRRVGTLQLGASLALVDAAQRTLLLVMGVGAIITMALAGLGGWLATGQALARLETVTQVATQITRADDLSRRIPEEGLPNDEVGELISAFNQTLARLEQLFTAQRRFVADVSHELRTPLTVIKGNVALLRRMGGVDEESLHGIEDEVDRLTRLVGDLLLLAQAESGRIPLDQGTVDLDELVMDVFQQMRVLAGERVQLRIQEIEPVQVTGDRDRLKQVLVNLVGNGLKYTPPGGQVALGLCQVDGGMARLVVKDTGPGIPEEDLPHIFERFYRAEKSRTRAKDGSGYGLGLSIAYWIVQAHGGRVEVSSQVGAGTTFQVFLPLRKTG